jgi:hypothetical protein
LGGLDVDEWYLCTGPTLRNMIQEWLLGKKTIYENFDYQQATSVVTPASFVSTRLLKHEEGKFVKQPH